MAQEACNKKIIKSQYTSSVIKHSYCSLSQNYSDWKLLLFYLPVWLVFTYNLLVYSFVGWKIMKSSKASVLASNGVGQNKQKIIASRNLRRYVIKTGEI